MDTSWDEPCMIVAHPKLQRNTTIPVRVIIGCPLRPGGHSRGCAELTSVNSRCPAGRDCVIARKEWRALPPKLNPERLLSVAGGRRAGGCSVEVGFDRLLEIVAFHAIDGADLPARVDQERSRELRLLLARHPV